MLENFNFPLYLHNSGQGLFEKSESEVSTVSNIAPSIIKEIIKNLGKEISPEDFFYYIYGVLYSNSYRKKYQEFLRIDFPRIPFTSNYDLLIKIGKLGEELANLHLMKSWFSSWPVNQIAGKRVKCLCPPDGGMEVYWIYI